MRVLIVSPIAPESHRQIGGTRTYTLGLLKECQRLGIKPVLLGIGTGGRFDDVPCISVTHNVPCSTVKFVLKLFLSMPRWLHVKPDVVNVQLSLAGLPFLLLRWPLIITMHGAPVQGVIARRGKKAGIVMRILENIVLWRADRVIFIDEKAREIYINMMPWLEAKSTTIPPAVDTETFHPRGKSVREALRQELALPFDGPVFAYLGRISPEKNVSGLIDAFTKYWTSEGKGVMLLMGTGPESEDISKRINRLGMESTIRLLSDLERTSISAHLAASDLFLLASFHEGLSIACLEALACGLPVIATHVGDLERIVIKGLTGEIVSSNEDLQAAISRAIGSNGKPGWATEEMREVCRRKAMEYSWDVIGQKVIRQYELAIEAIACDGPLRG